MGRKVRGHSFVRTHEEGGGLSKSVRHGYKGGGVGTSNYSFCMYVVISLVNTFITAFKRLTMTTPLSLKYFAAVFFLESLIGYLKVFPLEMRRGVIWL